MSMAELELEYPVDETFVLDEPVTARRVCYAIAQLSCCPRWFRMGTTSTPLTSDTQAYYEPTINLLSHSNHFSTAEGTRAISSNAELRVLYSVRIRSIDSSVCAGVPVSLKLRFFSTWSTDCESLGGATWSTIAIVP